MKYFLILCLVFFEIIGCQTAFDYKQKKGVRDVVRAHHKEFKRCSCNERQLAANPEGRVVFSWQIDNQGLVKNVKVIKSEIGAPNLEKCIANEISKLVFEPAPQGELGEVHYPFLFLNTQAEIKNNNDETIKCGEL